MQDHPTNRHHPREYTDGRIYMHLAGDSRRPLALAGLALLSLGGYLAIWPLMPAGIAGTLSPIVLVVAALAVPYALACWLLLRAPTPVTTHWRRIEWGVLICGALLFRAALFPLMPVLSRDAYRYAWDALVSAHGFSPYLHAPDWPGFNALRDVYYGHVPWKSAPTIYPPGAQLLYRVAYFFAPKSVWTIKAEMIACDLLAGLLLVLLLRRHGQDPRRAFIYLWAPLAVVEYALNGHVDAAAIALTLLILLVNDLAFRGARTMVGALLGFATLIKLYPLVFVVALVRRRDWTLLGALAATLAIGYLPFWREGTAAFGFLTTYLGQSDPNFGGMALVLRAIAYPLGDRVVQVLSLLGAAASVGLIFWLRVHLFSARQSSGEVGHTNRAPLLTPIQATYALVVVWLAFSPHVFAWYVPALLPFCALYLAPLVPRASVAVVNDRRTDGDVNAAQTVHDRVSTPALQGSGSIAAASAAGIWTFCCLIPLSYVAFEVPWWSWLYPALYPAVLALTLGCWLWWLWQRHLALGQAGGVPAASPTGSAGPDDVSPLRVS